VALDGDVVVAGALDPPVVYAWSLRTGALLNALGGHTAPVVALTFAPLGGGTAGAGLGGRSRGGAQLVSASWDGTVKLWDVYGGGGALESLSHAAEVLALAFRPDGRQLCAASCDGQLSFWALGSLADATDDGRLEGSIDGQCDLAPSGGRHAHERRLSGATQAYDPGDRGGGGDHAPLRVRGVAFSPSGGGGAR